MPYDGCDLAIADFTHQQIQAATEGAEWLSEKHVRRLFSFLGSVLLDNAVGVAD